MQESLRVGGVRKSFIGSQRMAKGTEIWVCPQCGFRMDIAPLGLYAEVQCPRCFRTERVHAQLGNFRLDAVLGVGGMSVVYRAFDVVLHRALALKVLNDTFRDQPERIERFENESAMMARVRHENVTSVYSAGRAYGQFYIAMELVEGKNLEYMVTAEQPMGAHQALDIIRQVTLGLRAAHEAGLLHRDMKPGNVLITPEGSAKVIDFGLAMDSREDDTEEIIWATPYYVPPETLKREPEDVRTDIYALGMTLRFLLTGIENFNEVADSLQALIQCKRKLMPLSKQRSGIPAALSELVDHMTEFDAADRPANYDELLAEIEEVQRELTSGSSSAAGKLRPFVSGAGVVTSLVLGVLLGFVFSPAAPSQKRALISLPASAQETRGDADVMPGVLSQLKNRSYGDAVNALLAAADRESDPCLGAWYAQLARTILCSCYDDSNAASSARDIFMRHLDAGSRVQPAAARSFAALKTMDTQRYPSARDWEQHAGEWNSLTRESISRSMQLLEQEDMHPILKVLKWGVLSRKAAWHGDADLEERCLSRIKAEAPSLGKYSVLAEVLSKSSDSGSSDQAGSEAAESSSAAKAAAKRFSHTPKEGALNKAQSQVYEEVATMADAMLEALQRRNPKANTQGMSNEELIKLALGLSPASRPAAWADASQPGHAESHAIDGRLDTRWCASNGDGGHSFVLDIDTPENISAVILHWEQSLPLHIRALVYSSGGVLSFEFDKDKMVSRLNVKNRRLDRLELSFPNGGGQGNWAGVVEVQLLTEDGRLLTPDVRTGRNDFADELRAVLLMMSGQYEAAFEQMDFVIARQGEDSPFGIIAADWKYRWSGEKPKSSRDLRKAEISLFERIQKKEPIDWNKVVAEGINPNARSADGRTNLLSAAIREKSLNGVRTLLDAGADANARLSNSASMLHEAADVGNAEIVRLLLERGANPLVQGGNSAFPIHNAIWNSNRDATLALLPCYKSMGYCPDGGQNGFPITLAIARRNDPAVVRALLEAGVNPNDKRFARFTKRPLLVMAVDSNQEEVARLLLQYGADKEARDEQGKRAIDYAKGNLVSLLK